MVTGAAVASAPAYAAAQGLCVSNVASICARDTGIGNTVDQWPQDISGDVHQQWSRTYLGKVCNSGGCCWPFKCGNGFNNVYDGNSVWAFSSDAYSEFACLTDGGATMYLEQCQFSGGSQADDEFVWTSVGVLVNVAATNATGAPQYLNGTGNYQALSAYNPGVGEPDYDWVMRNGS
ncbi:MAG TPA: hypothetical protein VGH27_26830 [Streptosporangiaceae bacterium]